MAPPASSPESLLGRERFVPRPPTVCGYADMTTASERTLINETAFDVLRRVPAIPRVMQVFRFGGATHERIGRLETVARDGDDIVCGGACHDARVRASAIASVIADRSGKMKDLELPRIDFRDKSGEVIFSIIVMEGGLKSFNAALEGLSESAAPAADPRETPERKELDEQDPGLSPFARAVEKAAPITIAVQGPGFRQAWSGIAESVKPGMGFINVMRPDFHLHLKGGAVADWRREGAGGEAVWTALDAHGAPTGLTVRGDIGL